jgi:hypothetical protein
LFLQNYLCLRIRDEVPVAHLYATFRETSTASNGLKAKDQLQSLRRYADIFQGFDKFEEGSRQAIFFKRLEAMELGTTYPYLMELFAQHGAKTPQVVEALGMIESYLVRRLVCQLTTRSYGRFFIDLIETIDGPVESMPERLSSALSKSTGESARWPDDDEFQTAWLNAPLYRTLLRSRLRMLLEALDQEYPIGYGEHYVLKEKLTVEHLLPQEWKPKWPLPEDATADQIALRDQMLHTIGNLTLLTKKLNPSVSNGAWSKKVADIKKHSRLHLNLDIINNWSDDWGEATIRTRGNSLFQMALKMWPR